MRIGRDNPGSSIARPQRRLVACFLPAALAFVAAVLPGIADAQTNWNVATGNWLAAGNWSAGLPTGSTNAFIDNGGTSQVLSTGAQARSIRVGDSAEGELEIASGGQLASASTSFIGYSSTGNGTATVSGEGATWSNSQSLYVGNHGAGQFTVSDGGSVTQFSLHVGFHPGSLGTAIVSSGGLLSSSNNTVQVASNGTGILTISDGGIVSSRTGGIATGSNGIGTVFVTGTDSTWTTTLSLSVGSSGTGVLEITSGGHVLVGASCSIGENADSDGTVLVAGENSNWSIGNELHVGEFGVGEINVSNGASLIHEDAGWIGKEFGSAGSVSVTGLNSKWNTNNSLMIGENGSAELKISDGGMVEVADVTRVGSAYSEGLILFNNGTLTTETLVASYDRLLGTGNINTHGLVSDTDIVFSQSQGLQRLVHLASEPDQNVVINLDVDGSGAIGAGFRDQSSIAVEGITVTSSYGVMGWEIGSSGLATIDGPDSVWVIKGSLFAGRFGNGEVIISGGGRVTSGVGYLGYRTMASGSVIVTGSNSVWENQLDILIGADGSGELAIENGGSVSARDGMIASTASSTGSITLLGGSSALSVSRKLYVGGGPFSTGGTGTLTIGPGATVSVTSETTLFPQATVNLEGGTLSTDAIKYQGTGGQFNWTSGTLHVGTYNGNLANPGGTLAPGQSPGSTTITGSYTQGVNATLEIELGGLVSGTQHDFVSVAGITSLNGELQLALLRDYIPLATDTFTILSSTGALTGMFTNIANAGRLDTTDGRGSFLVHYGIGSAFNSKQIVLTDFAMTGDYNGDGFVNAADYVLWRDTDGTATGYTGWQSTFGLAAGQGSGQLVNTAVPEPAAWRLVLCVLLVATLFAKYDSINCARDRI